MGHQSRGVLGVRRASLRQPLFVRAAQAHVSDLGDHLGVGGDPEQLRAPRLDSILPLGPRHGGVPDAQMAAQQPARPVHHCVHLRRRPQRRGHDLAMIDSAWLTPAHPASRPARPLGITISPPDHGRTRETDLLCDRRVRQPVRRPHSDPRPLRQTAPRTSGSAAPAHHSDRHVAPTPGQDDSLYPIVQPTNRKIADDAQH